VREMDGTRTTLSHVTSARDLVVWVTPQMDFSMQCQKAAAKATQALGVSKRTFKHLNKESFLLAYKSYIRPHLEYCVQLWNPHLIKDIDIIEKFNVELPNL